MHLIVHQAVWPELHCCIAHAFLYPLPYQWFPRMPRLMTPPWSHLLAKKKWIGPSERQLFFFLLLIGITWKHTVQVHAYLMTSASSELLSSNCANTLPPHCLLRAAVVGIVERWMPCPTWGGRQWRQPFQQVLGKTGSHTSWKYYCNTIFLCRWCTWLCNFFSLTLSHTFSTLVKFTHVWASVTWWHKFLCVKHLTKYLSKKSKTFRHKTYIFSGSPAFPQPPVWPHISMTNDQIGTFEAPILCSCTVGSHMCHMNEWFVYLGAGRAWQSTRNHGCIVLVCHLLYCST